MGSRVGGGRELKSSPLCPKSSLKVWEISNREIIIQSFEENQIQFIKLLTTNTITLRKKNYCLIVSSRKGDLLCDLVFRNFITNLFFFQIW